MVSSDARHDVLILPNIVENFEDARASAEWEAAVIALADCPMVESQIKSVPDLGFCLRRYDRHLE